jgi:hypothetical protein
VFPNPLDGSSLKISWSEHYLFSFKICPRDLNVPRMEPCYSKFGLQTNNLDITYEPVRSAESQAHGRPTESDSAF